MPGRRRSRPRGTPEFDESGLPTGLSGPVDIPDPPPQPRLSWRGRLRKAASGAAATVAGLPRVLSLCWRASPSATVLLAVLTVVVGLFPVLTASTARLLVDAVVRAVGIRTAGGPDQSPLILPLPGDPQIATLTGVQVVFWLAVTQFVVYVLDELVGAARFVVERVLSDRLTLTVETMVAEKASQLELTFFEQSESYDLLQRAASQGSRPFSTLTTFFRLLQTVVTFVSMIGLLISLNPWLGLIVLAAPIPAFIVDTRYGQWTYARSRWTSPVSRRIWYLQRLLTTDSDAKEIKIFNLGPYLVERYRLLSANYDKKLRELAIRRQLAELGWSMLDVLARSGSYLYVALQAAAGRLSLGDLTLYGAAASSVQSSVSAILSALTSMYENNLYVDDLYRLMATPTEKEQQALRQAARASSSAAAVATAAVAPPPTAAVHGAVSLEKPGSQPATTADPSSLAAVIPAPRDRGRAGGTTGGPEQVDERHSGLAPTGVPPFQPVPLPTPLRGHVVFEGVSFRYPGTGEPALTDVSFEVAPGETIAIVGRNGAGKSTLIKLLCRLYSPDSGRILVDGVDIADVDADELRSQISAVFQDHVSFQATAAENIGLGDLARLADRPRVERAGQAGGADEFVRALAYGYDTALGRWFGKGVDLSGGQWQKLALARGFMRDAQILVLDEPSAALDARAEHDLFARLRALATGRTAFYISHRFSTVRQANRIIFLDDGRLTESGTHRELMALAGQYAELFTLQAAAYLDDAPEPPAPEPPAVSPPPGRSRPLGPPPGR
ncbi:ABC transporter ATP-binding protein [Frankia sp. CNm7]|uniref:ABC transporter ATP-binding protein n=1 Tax=Frankia nepalensis TaxID=1836974 RepID=A0A937UJP5_9ACTN|nr:ABC transporter ATP-binding protein [Frankia nepalensis]MBL7495437.1 ABC transporter ATP-binding protein [Frankia nepalensis]MBL7510733.1 ABC transporter ATP-binding protein [Frankia nepalensis]MBL7522676.1 ABC transporter ATP-binding protein [Frankia nepalensis]MBL7625994.1 ABC transporter ATP-binding protein [Frankia nepalensis]